MVKLAIIAGAVLALSTASAAFADAGGCHQLSGTYVQEFVPCDVPALACVDSTTTGDLAFSHTVITGFDPATQILTGTVTLSRDNGSIITATIETVRRSGVAVETITGGTRQFAHATGTIVAAGGFVGTYSGQYCLGNGPAEDG